ncbi:MAG: 2-succinyl-5-enolpyruvyl-6-hydroxy-3-cyclohexene-1-carboxylic-acid synthase [Candidatus Omnitrophica bacterium]|jgi:2-succinyl-5-enolpyruvyl-6-hydroxy-3-cyclohexene-1-carboxylate synthase|nr:2-succinyl-5-enolpyruvyl-6-hydroxy-3-cyclohexene-1-carboxylic-acid synthase [Candidatus Omnitrophota bacterium]
MYTSKKNVQILIALLKEYGITHFVLSPGTRNVPFVYSVENDPFFTCYSVVDERSAAFFAMGLAQELNRPVGISCTSATATANYLSAVTEAFYQKVPLLILTGDRDPYLLGQMEDQQIKQFGMYADVVKKQVNLPLVRNDEDFWYCERLVNEALLELEHRGKGPVHINIPIVSHEKSFSEPCLPTVKAIRRIGLSKNTELCRRKISELKSTKKILVVCGQRWNLNPEEEVYIEEFFSKYNCVIATDHMSNLNCSGNLKLFLAAETISADKLDELTPDILISFGGNFIANGFKAKFRSKKVKHWLVNEDGSIVDVFKNLTDIYECTSSEFFKFFVGNAGEDAKNDMGYYEQWKQQVSQLIFPEMPFSAYSVIKEFAGRVPDNSILHLSILNSIRICNYFDIPKNVKTYANLGAHGIDGSMSTFLGQSVVSDKLSFLVVGDLSFLYDMNSVRIKHIKSNVRILLVNNRGGSEFYINTGKKNSPNLDLHTAAKHDVRVQGWVESLGFKYLSAESEKEYLSQLDAFFVRESERPVVFEVFTDTQTDADAIHALYKANAKSGAELSVKNKLKEGIKDILGESGVKKIRKLMGGGKGGEKYADT